MERYRLRDGPVYVSVLVLGARSAEDRPGAGARQRPADGTSRSVPPPQRLQHENLDALQAAVIVAEVIAITLLRYRDKRPVKVLAAAADDLAIRSSPGWTVRAGHGTLPGRVRRDGVRRTEGGDLRPGHSC